jgi:hypothetical protein
MTKRLAFCYASVLLLSALAGCTTAISPPPSAIEVDRNVALPITLDKIWYRTGKIRPFGMAWEESGVITITADSIEFAHETGTIKIPRESMQKVEWGKLSPDISNDWVIVYYSNPGGNAVAAFKGALFAGGGRDSVIYSAALQVMKGK